MVAKNSSDRWNARYGASTDVIPQPARVLSDGEHWLRLPEAGPGKTAGSLPTALDLACGRGGNGEWLGRRGYRVFAWDISDTVIDAISQREASAIACPEVRDVVAHPPEPGRFDVIVVSRFLSRELSEAIILALKPGGLLFYQTFTKGLSSPDFMLSANELLSLFSALHILEYHEPEADASGKAEARLIARRSV